MTRNATETPPASIEFCPLAERLPLDRIKPSDIHLRQGKDQLRDAELLESVKRQGILQAILVRPVPPAGHYQMVAGHRRFAAAQAAGHASIPATSRELTDAEALELQVIENQQRTDVHPLEEAEGYRLLCEMHHCTVEDLAAKVGKSKAYIYGRLKLAALGKLARAAFLDGKLEASVALLIARIPGRLQEKALKDVLFGGYSRREGPMPLNYRAAAALIQRDYMLRLAGAPFDPKESKLGSRAGACEPCPKRTGNQRDLFGDVKRTDICTDPLCFQAKAAAAAEDRRAKLEAEGRTVLTGDQAKKIFRYHDIRAAHGCGYVTLDQNEYLDNGDSTKVGALLARHAAEAETVYCERPDGRIVELARTADVERALAKAQPKQAKARTADKARASAQRKRQDRARLLQNASILLVLEKSRGAKDAVIWLYLAAHLGDYFWPDTVKQVLNRRGLMVKNTYQDGAKALATWVGKDAAKARELVLDLVLTRGRAGFGNEDAALRAAVKLFKLAPDAVKRRANAEQAAAEAAKKLKPARAKKWPKGKPAPAGKDE